MEIRNRLDSCARTVLEGATALSLALIPFGWHFGYHAAGAYLLFWAFITTTLVTSLTIAQRSFPWTGAVDAAIRIGVLAFAVIVACGLLLGSLGLVTPGGYVALLAVISTVTAVTLARRGASCWPRFSAPPLTHLPIAAIGILAALIAFMGAFAMTHAPLTLYDSLSYHLFFSARWLLDHRVSIVPTPFSDEAQAYAPGNGELYLLWLMLPFHGDLLARAGQLAFALLGAAVVYALARRLGARREHAIYPAAFFLLSRQVLEQAVGADVDLICAAMFLASLYLGILAIDRNSGRDWGIWGVSLGLYWGSKYLALAYTPIFLLLALARGIRVRTAWAVPGVVAFALPWYLRNWIVAGSPIYPASLQVAGVTLGHGAFRRTAMLNSMFHTDDVRLFPAMAAHLFGPTLFLFWLPFALIGAWACARRGWWPNGFVLLVPVLMVPLYWFGFPVNIDSRFLMPALGAALLPFAFAFRGSRKWNAGVHATYLLGMFWIIIGVHARIPAALPWFMADWLALNGLLQSRFIIAFGAVAMGIAASWRLISSRPRWAIPSTALLVGAIALALTLGADRWCLPAKCDYLDTTSPYVRSGLIDAWTWLAGNVNHSTIAYTGINLPYPLSGDQLTNRVIYVNIDGHPRWRFHDYDRAYREGRFHPEPPLLATSSGELRPVIQRAGPRDDAARPRYGRMEGFRDGWISNLRTFSVTHLFVSSLSAYEIDYLWHNEGGFPIEDEWARADPRGFQLVYENLQVRIYAVVLPEKFGI